MTKTLNFVKCFFKQAEIMTLILRFFVTIVLIIPYVERQDTVEKLSFRDFQNMYSIRSEKARVASSSRSYDVVTTKCACVCRRQQERRLSDELTRPNTLPHPHHSRTQHPASPQQLSVRRSESQPQLNGRYILHDSFLVGVNYANMEMHPRKLETVCQILPYFLLFSTICPKYKGIV